MNDDDDLVFNDVLFRLAWRAHESMTDADRMEHKAWTCAFCRHPTQSEDQFDLCVECNHSFAAHEWGALPCHPRDHNRCLVAECSCATFVDMSAEERAMRDELLRMQIGLGLLA